MKKLAFICARGLDTFIDDIYTELSVEYFTRKFIVSTGEEIDRAMDWADIVWLEWANEVAVYATNHSAGAHKKVLVRLHSYEALSHMPRQINWAAVDRLIFVAPHIRELVKGYIPDIERKVKTVVINNGVDLRKIEPVDVKPGYNIAVVCTISHKKNPPLALQIMRMLVDRDARYRLYWAGAFQEPRYEIYLKYMVREMGLEHAVVFHGFVSDMNTWWKDKHFLLSTSIHEGHPYNVLEAMARQIKPAVHNFYGARKLFPDCSLYNTVGEAVALITGNTTYDYRAYLQLKGWTLEHQVARIKEMIRGCESHE